MIRDELFMLRAIELAGLGAGDVSPNPRVGCVIVHDDRIIGEGWHRRWGEAHAEVNAIASVSDHRLLRESTVYVNLEPCSHTGKTPPCANLLVSFPVKKVVIANGDPNPLVSGRGIQLLVDAGVEVVTGVLAEQGRELNRRFFTSMEKHRSYVILKWAQTADGFIARKNYDSKWISNEFSRQAVHRWRSEEDAVLVGRHTAAVDHPALSVRDWSGRDPVRIVIDRHLSLQELSSLDQHTICYNTVRSEEIGNVTRVRLGESNFIGDLLTDLNRRNLQSLIVEGGATTLNLFIDGNHWDEARIFQSAETFGEGIRAPEIVGEESSSENIFTDTLKIFRNIKS